jgi:selenium-binding protein 1
MKSRLSRRFLVGFAVAVLAAMLAVPVTADGFIRGIVVNVDGVDYYLAGPPDAPGGARDVPGHYWVQAGPNKIVGKHYNTGPFNAPSWWSSDAGDGEFLFKVDGIIDTWTADKAERYAEKGYVHYHELVRVDDGSLHPDKVVWFRHIARTSFTLDGGPHPPDPGIEITPGVAFNFLPNWSQPYSP